jgi:hypothetical protein
MAGQSSPATLAASVAAAWSMLAELDPELAKRMAGYAR